MASVALKKTQIEFERYSEDAKRSMKVRHEGFLFTLDGRDVVLFPASVMASAIERDIKTLRRWEREKLWPKPQFKPPNVSPFRRCKRWYSANQIMFVYNEYKRVSKGSWGYSHSAHFPLEEFLKTVRAGWYKCDAAVAAQEEKKVNG